MNILDHDDCLKKCAELKVTYPKIFAEYNRQRNEGGFYPAKGTKERSVIDEYERLSNRAARFAGGF